MYQEAEILSRAGFALDNGILSDRTGGESLDAPQKIALPPDGVRENGLPREISRQAAAVVRDSFRGLQIREFPPETLERWQYILPHFRPHMDEYLSSLFLRACLPDGMSRRLQLGETFLTSRDDDPQAKALWPRAAVLGIGATVNGGAAPLLLFDEHESYGAERENSSLVILMKRYLLGKQRPPFPFYQMLNEVNYIDMYGGGHSKNLATYVKYLNALPPEYFGGDEYAPAWKSAMVDAFLTAFYLGLREPSQDFKDRAKWEPALRSSLSDYAERTALKDDPEFPAAKKKITRYLTTIFARSQAQGELKITMTDKSGARVVKGRDTGHETDLNLLVPYLPYLCFKAWGRNVSQLLLFFLWESRFHQEMTFSRTFAALCAAIPKDCASGTIETPVGTVTIATCERPVDKDGTPFKVYDLASGGGIAPGPLNRYLRTRNAGFGLTIFRDASIHSTVITRGEAVDAGLWERVCEALVAREGATEDMSGAGGAWHMTRNPNGGIAAFLLNGNPTHRYAPATAITAQSLAELAEECASADA
ncbi:MAG: hypothetical protein IKN96_03590 [Oscillibacter sp.]|nr:hypothetical protein [Oscillibacter sp.]